MPAPGGAAATQSTPLPAAALAALGVVYGDLGTSPLYTLQTVIATTGGRFSSEAALGVLSLIIWTLIVSVSIKYCLMVMRADNHGEGGILALMSLVGGNRLSGAIGLLTAAGLLGAALIYGDGVITPAISVLSALEGVNVVTRDLAPYVMPVAVAILLALFAVQRLGTASIGAAFGPVMLVWFGVIGALGLFGLIHHPAAIAAVDPRHALSLLVHARGVGLLVLGGVFLCTTGAEALYADMGHFGRRPIRISWYGLVLPALVLNYAGQTGLLLEKPHFEGNPFFQIAPGWAIWPLVGLATVATIIASQSIITGAFSMTRQAVQLGWLPGMSIRQTSDQVYGQIYVPVVNALMMAATIGVTIGFGSSERLAGAYGVAVSTTMLMTTVLLYAAMLRVWRWSALVATPLALVFLVIDAGYFGANLLKILDGGWVSLTLGAVIFVVMAVWRTGVDAVRKANEALSEPADVFLQRLKDTPPPRPPGAAVFLTRAEETIPSLLVDYVRLIGSLHETVVILSVLFEETPRVEPARRARVERLAGDIWRVALRFGFVEIPDLPAALANAKGLKTVAPLDGAVYFSSRDLVTAAPGRRRRLGGWPFSLFAWMFRNAAKVVDRFALPPLSVIEIARELEI